MTDRRFSAIIPAAVLGLLINVIPAVNAQSATPTASTTIPPERLEKIKLLKERVATKVAQLREKKEKPDIVAGEVRIASGSALTIGTSSGDVSVAVTKDTKIIQIDKRQAEIEFENIMPEQLILVIGKKQNDSFTAQEIFLRPLRQILIGKVSTIDRPNGQFLLATAGGVITIDVERTTRTNRYDKDKEKIVRSGFSKLAVGNSVHVVASPTDDPNLVTGIRVLIIPIEKPSPTPTKEVEETAESNGQASPTPK